MEKEIKSINSVAEMEAIMRNAKCGGQFVTITAETPIKLNKFPTDGRKRCEEDRINFTATNRFRVKFNFGKDYDKAMSALLGYDYKATDSNREHIVPNVMMRYISTGNTCLIYMPNEYEPMGTFFNGHEASAEEKARIALYKSNSTNNSPMPYRTVGVRNVTKVCINHVEYNVNINTLMA